MPYGTVDRMVQISPLIALDLGERDGDGQPITRHLRINWAALRLLEQGGTRSIMDAATWNNLEITEVCEFLAVSLRHEDPQITAKQVGQHIGPHNLPGIFQALAMAWNSSQTGNPDYVPLEVPLAA